FMPSRMLAMAWSVHAGSCAMRLRYASYCGTVLSGCSACPPPKLASTSGTAPSCSSGRRWSGERSKPRCMASALASGCRGRGCLVGEGVGGGVVRGRELGGVDRVQVVLPLPVHREALPAVCGRDGDRQPVVEAVVAGQRRVQRVQACLGLVVAVGQRRERLRG